VYAILLILRACCDPQVRAPVVEFVAIFVIGELAITRDEP
jgi:hypothetical protein